MPDEVIAEVRRIRHEISEESGHDVDRLVSHLQEIEATLRESGEVRFAETSGGTRPSRATVPPDSGI